jgi:hypothetical protein
MKFTALILSLSLSAFAMAATAPVECLRDTKNATLRNILSPEKALKLCAGSKSHAATIDCFRDAIRSSGLDLDVDSAIELCRER